MSTDRHTAGDPERGGQRTRRRSQRSRSLADTHPWVEPAVTNGLIGALFLLLIWAPIPAGSNRPFYLSLAELSVGALLLVWAVAAVTGALKAPRKLLELWPAGLAFLIAMLVAGFQVVDLRALDSTLGTSLAKDWGHPIWQLAGETLGRPVPVYVTVNPAMAEPAFAKSFVYAGIFVLAFVLARRSAGARTLLTFVAVAGAATVLAGVAQKAAGFHFGGALIWEEVAESNRFGSTFANPNNFATFAGIAFIAALGLTHDALSKGIVSNRGRDIAVRTTLSTLLGPALPGLASAVLLGGAILTSASRAGALSMMAGCVTLVLMLYFSRMGSSDRQGSAVASWMLAGMLLTGGILAGAPLLSRIDYAGFDDFVRNEIADRTMGAVVASPVAGNGFGAFEAYYPLYETTVMRGTVNAAHNDYLETLADLGVIGGTALILAPAYLVFLALQGAFKRRKGRIYGAVAVGAAALVAVHAFFEFSLQIPAVGMLFYTLLGVGVAQAWRGDDEPGGDPRMSA